MKQQRDEMIEIVNDDKKWARFQIEFGLELIKYFRHGFISGIFVGGIVAVIFGCMIGMRLAK